MSLPDDLPKEFMDCLANKTCGDCEYLKCSTFLAGRTEHLKRKLGAVEDSKEDWRPCPKRCGVLSARAKRRVASEQLIVDRS